METDPRSLGLQLKGLLDAYEAAVQEQLARLPEDLDSGEALDRIAAITREYRMGDCLLEVSRRRSHIPCPVPDCPHGKGGRPADHSSLRSTLTCADREERVSAPGLLWHLLTDHDGTESGVSHLASALGPTKVATLALLLSRSTGARRA